MRSSRSFKASSEGFRPTLFFSIFSTTIKTCRTVHQEPRQQSLSICASLVPLQKARAWCRVLFMPSSSYLDSTYVTPVFQNEVQWTLRSCILVIVCSHRMATITRGSVAEWTAKSNVTKLQNDTNIWCYSLLIFIFFKSLMQLFISKHSA